MSWWTLGGSGLDNKGNNPAALFGGEFALGEVGTSFVLDGVDDYGSVGASPCLNVGTGAGFTIDMWINPADTSTEHPLVEWNSGSGLGLQSQFWISVNGPGGLFTNILSPDGTYHSYSSAPGS